MLAILLIIALIVFPSFAAALLSLLFHLVCLLFKLAFTFWQVSLFVLFIIFLAGILG